MTSGKTEEQMLQELLQEVLGGAKEHGSNPLNQIKAILPMVLQEIDGVVEISDEVLNKIAPKIAEYLDKLREFHVESRIKTFKAYRDAGMTEASAVSLIQSDAHNQAMAFRNLQK